MTEELTQCINAGKISKTDTEKLLLLSPGAYCKHRSWGFGRIAEWQLLTDQVLIDFTGKKKHPMQLKYAIETLTHIPTEHILARICDDPEAIRNEAKKDPIGLIRSILQSYDGAATSEQIAEILVPAVFDQASFKKWFDTTKKKLKTDGHFVIPTKKTEPFQLQETKIEPHDRLLEQFQKARHPKEQVIALDSLLKIVRPSLFDRAILEKTVSEIEETAARNERLHTTKAVELLLAAKELVQLDKSLEERTEKLSLATLLKNVAKKLSPIFNDLPASKYRRLLTIFPEAFEANWSEQAQQLLRTAEPRLIGEVLFLFDSQNDRKTFGDIIARMIQDRSATSDLLAWICEERASTFPELINSDLLAAIISALERDMHSEIKKHTRLEEVLFEDRDLIADLLKSADLDTARNVVRKIMASPFFSDLDRRSLLARVLKVHPDLQSLVTGHQEKETPAIREESLIVSWPSLERRKNEYEHLVNKLIPQNTKDISIARSYGDLRENFEFKSAKEQQTVLLRQKGELELMLNNARGTNFENPDTSVVSIGTVVTLKDNSTGKHEDYSILGAWDGAPEKRWVSYQAVIGKALLGRKKGDVITLPSETGDRSMTLEKIEAFTDIIPS